MNNRYFWAVGFRCWLLRFRRFLVAMPPVCATRYIEKLRKVSTATTAAWPSLQCIVKHWHSWVMSATTY